MNRWCNAASGSASSTSRVTSGSPVSGRVPGCGWSLAPQGFRSESPMRTPHKTPRRPSKCALRTGIRLPSSPQTTEPLEYQRKTTAHVYHGLRAASSDPTRHAVTGVRRLMAVRARRYFEGISSGFSRNLIRIFVPWGRWRSYTRKRGQRARCYCRCRCWSRGRHASRR